MQTLHILNQLLKAHALYKRDVHYMVNQEGRVLIIDEFTEQRVLSGPPLVGRPAPGSGGQGESLRIQEESRTMATITFQNFFRTSTS